MKANSKILSILTALFVIAMVISSVNAVNLVNSDDFSINSDDGSQFIEIVNTDINVTDMALKTLVFENSSDASGDVSSIVYFKESSDNTNIISDLYDSLKKDGEIVEENDNYTIFNTSSSGNLFNFDLPKEFGSAKDIAENVISSIDGVNISSKGNSLSLSDAGVNISDGSGDNISISTGDEASGEVDLSAIGNAADYIKNGEYIAFVKTPNNDQAVLVVGNNVDAVKNIADNTSF